MPQRVIHLSGKLFLRYDLQNRQQKQKWANPIESNYKISTVKKKIKKVKRQPKD